MKSYMEYSSQNINYNEYINKTLLIKIISHL
jgi:hypothetical protein